MSDLLLTRRAVVVDPFQYTLERDMHRTGRSAAVVMVNPSTADHREDDQTIRKLYGFAERAGIGRFTVVNKFAFRATDVDALRSAQDPVGPDNDLYIEAAFRENDMAIVAWGPLAKLPRHLRARWREVTAIADQCGKPLLCLGTAGDGHPRHPCMLGYANALRPWSPPE